MCRACGECVVCGWRTSVKQTCHTPTCSAPNQAQPAHRIRESGHARARWPVVAAVAAAGWRYGSAQGIGSADMARRRTGGREPAKKPRTKTRTKGGVATGHNLSAHQLISSSAHQLISSSAHQLAPREAREDKHLAPHTHAHSSSSDSPVGEQAEAWRHGGRALARLFLRRACRSARWHVAGAQAQVLVRWRGVGIGWYDARLGDAPRRRPRACPHLLLPPHHQRSRRAGRCRAAQLTLQAHMASGCGGARPELPHPCCTHTRMSSIGLV